MGDLNFVSDFNPVEVNFESNSVECNSNSNDRAIYSSWTGLSDTIMLLELAREFNFGFELTPPPPALIVSPVSDAPETRQGNAEM